MKWLDNLSKTRYDNYWDEIEAVLYEMRKKRSRRERELHDAMIKLKIAELANEMNWWTPLPKEKINKEQINNSKCYYRNS